MVLETFSNKDRKIVGALHSDGAYRTKRKSSVHLLKVMDAWGIDEVILEKIRERASSIRLLDTDKGMVYVVDMDTFVAKSIPKDFGYGAQRFLPRSYWTIVKSEGV